MSVFADLQPRIGVAAACVALSINRSGVYAARARWARRGWSRFTPPTAPHGLQRRCARSRFAVAPQQRALR